MAQVTVATRDGTTHRLAAADGETLMEAIKEGGIDELLALCGGCLACATCHVHVDPDQLSLLPPMAEDEAELLANADDLRATSRLSCQITVTAALDGLRVSIPSEE